MFWRWCLKLLLENFINSHRSQDQHHAYQWFIVYVFIFVDTSSIHRLAATLKETNMFRDSICRSECQKKCSISISDRQSADTPPDSSNSAVESVRKFVKSALQMKWQSFNMPFGLSLILHLAHSFKKGKVPIVKQMLPVMVRSVYATKYCVEHLRHFKHKTIAKFLLESTISVRKSGISWRKSHSFYTTRGIPLKDRRIIRILRAHAWKKKLHFEPSKYSMELKAVLLGGNSTTTGVFYETTWPMGNSQWKVHHSEKVHASRHGNIWRLTHGGPPPGDTPGNTVMAGAPSHWLKKMICPDLKTAAIQWRYTAITGNYGVSFQ